MKQRWIVLFLIFLSACFGTADINPTPALDSGIFGKATLGPMCPVQREDDPCPPQPYQATFTIVTQGGIDLGQIVTAEDGTFRVALPPGEYVLYPELQAIFPFASEQAFTVRVGEYTEILLEYDTGIR